jgi:hypothetical protein
MEALQVPLEVGRNPARPSVLPPADLRQALLAVVILVDRTHKAVANDREVFPGHALEGAGGVICEERNEF